MKKYFWMFANATTSRQFEDMLELLHEKNNFGTIKEDSLTYPSRFWCNAFFRIDVKCNVCYNNLFETLNDALVQARHKPIITMLKDIKVAKMTRIAQKNEVVGRWVGNHGPLVIEKLPKNMAKVTWWRVVFNGDDGYEVKCGWKQLKVNIARKTYTCKSWDY